MSLSVMQTMQLYDVDGRCRCPRCGKYRTPDDFPKQPSSAPIGDGVRVSGHVHLAPACRESLGGGN